MPASKLLDVVVLALAFASCAGSQALALSGRVREVRAAVEAARDGGARRCAPRELALATAHLEFAQRSLEADDRFGAEDHLRIAESNAREALRLSPPERCRDARNVGATPPASSGVPTAPGRPPARRVTAPNNRPDQPRNMQEYAWR
jgi:hypothetical protein